VAATTYGAVQTASTAAAVIEDEQGVRAGRSTTRLRYDEGVREGAGDRASRVRIGNRILQLGIHGLDMGFGGLGII
jgi:hypothetical protein